MSDETLRIRAAELSDMLGVKVFAGQAPHQPRETQLGDLAGIYEMACVLWDEPIVVLTPHPVTGTLIENHRSIRHLKGDLVKLSDEQARRLLASDAVVIPGERERIELEQAEAHAAQLLAQSKHARAALKDLQERVDGGLPVEELWAAGAAALTVDGSQ